MLHSKRTSAYPIRKMEQVSKEVGKMLFCKLAEATTLSKFEKFPSVVFKWENSKLRAEVIAVDRRAYLFLSKPTFNGKERKISLNVKELEGLAAILDQVRNELRRCEEHIQKNCRDGVRSDDEKCEEEEVVMVAAPSRPSVKERLGKRSSTSDVTSSSKKKKKGLKNRKQIAVEIEEEDDDDHIEEKTHEEN